MSVVFESSRKCFVALEYLIFRKYGSRAKLSAVIERQVQEDIENDKFTPKHHPGILKLGVVNVPLYVQKAIQVLLKDKPVKSILSEGNILARQLKGRHPPPEEHEIREKRVQLEELVQHESGVDLSSLGDEARELACKRQQARVQQKLRQHIHRWHPLQCDNRHRALLYLLGRAAPNYASVSKVLHEVKHRWPLFVPRSVFDFGSGVGTTTWAVRELWQDVPKEYFCVDASAEMNDLASLLLRDGHENKEMPLRGVFYRQFLPATSERQYDLVVSAHSLFELPSCQSRLEMLLSLWNKTHQLLVLVEQGTNSGFKLIHEARDFLLNISRRHDDPAASAHVFAPCPHDAPCPRFLHDTIPCNFEVSYTTLPFGQRSNVLRERYSYLVMRRGPVDAWQDRLWPRLVSPTLVRRKHSVCRMCTPDGQLREVIFTAAKHGKSAYRCARASRWGDLLPVRLEVCQDPASSSDSASEGEEQDSPLP